MAILAHRHEAETEYDLAFTVSGDRAAPHFVADLHVGHIAEEHRYAVLRGELDETNLFEACGATETLHE